MRFVKFLGVAGVLFILEGCATQECKPVDGLTLKGTDTAIVGLYVDNKGFPQTNIQKVTVYPGQKILFAGPNQFDILFKERKSPVGKLELSSTNGVVVIEIPRDIFEKEKNMTSASEKKELIYNYGIRVNGKITDPTIHVIPR